MEFYKYHGNGNDFIMFDGRSFAGNFDIETRRKMCHRRFGIGADGVIILKDHSDFDFEMKYYNSDGNESSMCGNGGRCIVKFAHELGIISNKTSFLAIDGAHEGIIEKNGWVSLKMKNVEDVAHFEDDFVIDTGSPHYVRFVKELSSLDVFKQGREIRNSPPFEEAGINVNFLEHNGKVLKLRTYERGVEDETFSCGTGVVAAALISSVKLDSPNGNIDFQLDTPGGDFEVSFNKSANNHFTNIWLKGAAEFVFKGELDFE